MANTQILVVEDEATVARNIQLELDGMGYTIPAIASSGAEALEAAHVLLEADRFEWTQCAAIAPG